MITENGVYSNGDAMKYQNLIIAGMVFILIWTWMICHYVVRKQEIMKQNNGIIYAPTHVPEIEKKPKKKSIW